MSLRLRITASAERDIRRQHQWWADYRSVEQADRWLLGIDKAIAQLPTGPVLHPLADEVALRARGVRQALFGLGSRPSHRILYAVEPQAVVVYRVRSLRQRGVGLSELDDDPS